MLNHLFNSDLLYAFCMNFVSIYTSHNIDLNKVQSLLKPFTQRSREATYCLMNCTASSYFIPHSMRAKATKTGALRGKEIRWTSSRRQWGGDGRKREENIKCQGPHGSIVIWWERGRRGFKPGKPAWEINRGAQVHRCPAGALCSHPEPHTLTHSLTHAITYSKTNFSFITRVERMRKNK